MYKQNLKDDLTVLVCSCDAYEDLWVPFFTLFKKYWPVEDTTIIFNTESKDFAFEGLNIKCVHTPGEKKYGKRMLNALASVETQYVLLLLDDFFLRSPVSEEKICQIVSWMKEDKDIAYFNCDALETYADYELDKYPGFKRVPPANAYTLNMQAAIWRTEILKEFWKPNASPWEWELIYNISTIYYPKYKFFCVKSAENMFLDYGHYLSGDIWGVYRGKWVVEDVKPLFQKENINIDFGVRGVYSGEVIDDSSLSLENFYKKVITFCEIRSLIELPVYLLWEIIRVVFKKKPYYVYLMEKERNRFLLSK